MITVGEICFHEEDMKVIVYRVDFRIGRERRVGPAVDRDTKRGACGVQRAINDGTNSCAECSAVVEIRVRRM